MRTPDPPQPFTPVPVSTARLPSSVNMARATRAVPSIYPIGQGTQNVLLQPPNKLNEGVKRLRQGVVLNEIGKALDDRIKKWLKAQRFMERQKAKKG